MKILEYAKQHPVIIGAVALVGAFAFYEIALAPSGSSVVASTSASGTDDATQQAEIAAAGNAASLQAGLNQQSAQISGTLQQQAASNAANEYLANLSAGTQLALNDQNVGLTQTVDLAQLTTQQAINTNNNQTSEDISNISSTLQQNLATIFGGIQTTLATTQSNTVLGLGAQQSDVTKTLAGLQASTTVAQINAAQNVAVANANVAKQQSDNNLIGGLVGGILGIL